VRVLAITHRVTLAVNEKNHLARCVFADRHMSAMINGSSHRGSSQVLKKRTGEVSTKHLWTDAHRHQREAKSSGEALLLTFLQGRWDEAVSRDTTCHVAAAGKQRLVEVRCGKEGPHVSYALQPSLKRTGKQRTQ